MEYLRNLILLNMEHVLFKYVFDPFSLEISNEFNKKLFWFSIYRIFFGKFSITVS